MWNQIKDYMIWGLAILLAVWQLVEEVKKGKSKWKIFLLSIGIVIFFWLGIDQINRLSKEKRDTTVVLESLNGKVDDIQKAKKQDSVANAENNKKDALFQQRLFDEFRITRDSAENKPVQKTFNTNIDKARDVFIGRD